MILGFPSQHHTILLLGIIPTPFPPLEIHYLHLRSSPDRAGPILSLSFVFDSKAFSSVFVTLKTPQ